MLLKKGKGTWDQIPFLFLNDSDIFFKYFNTNHKLLSYSLFSKCFSWFFYFGVHRGTGDFSWFSFSWLLLSCVTRPRACSTFPLTEKRWKIAPVLQIQPPLMKLRVRGFPFLVFFYIETDGLNKLLSITTSTLR